MNGNDENVYDKLRLLNRSHNHHHAWSAHPSAWYVPSPVTSAAVAAVAFSHHMNSQVSPIYDGGLNPAFGNIDNSTSTLANNNNNNYLHHIHNNNNDNKQLLDLNGNECKKGKSNCIFCCCCCF
jgi:hypothetical protein